MKFKTLLMASAAVLVAAPAFAQDDITAAFYTPAQGKFLSDTNLQASRFKGDDGADEYVSKGRYVSEWLTYGLTDNLALIGGIGNTFDVDGYYNNDHNFSYDLGVKYTKNWNKVLGQVSLSYQTMDPTSWYGKGDEGINYSTNKWEKVVVGQVALGYALDCGLTPYTTFTVNNDVTHSAKDKNYSWFMGAHKMLDRVSLDGGVSYHFNSDDYEHWYAQAEANYFVTDNMTVGLWGDYYLGGTARKDVDYNYTYGLDVKVAF